MKKIWIFVGVCLVLVAGYWLWPRKREPAVSYQTAQVERGDLSKSIQASGSVAPQNRVGLRPPFSGRVESVLVREGDFVKKGQILAWLSSSERAALLDAARARGPEEIKKWEELYRATPMLAPIAGTLIARSFEPGQGVSAADAILTLSDRLIVRANVDETDIAQVKVGQPARLTLDAYPDQPFAARAVHIAYEARNVSSVTVYEVEVAAEKTPAFMRSGMTASVDFYTERRSNVLLIPNEAIQPLKEDKDKKMGRGDAKEGGRRVMVLVPKSMTPSTKSAEPIEKAVHLGMSDGKYSEVLEGLAEGDSILVKSLALPSAASAGSNPFMPQRTARPPRGRGNR